MKYDFRENKKEDRSFELKETALIYNSTKSGEEETAYDSINKIILLSPMKNVYVCQIIYQNKKRIAFANRSFKSLDSFDYKNEEYISFLDELHERLRNYSAVEFSAGSSFLYYFMLISIPLIILVSAIAIVLATSSGKRLPLSLFIGLIIVIPFAIHYMRKGKKIIYKPGDIPKKYLP